MAETALKAWRRLLADALSAGLAEPGGPDVTVYPSPVPPEGAVSVPCVLLFSGGLDYVTSNADDAYVVKDFIAHDSTFCRALVQFRALLVGGIAGDETAYDQVDDWLDRLDDALDLIDDPRGAQANWTRATPVYNIVVGVTSLAVSAVEINLVQL